MKEHRNWTQRLTEAADLAGETIPGIPVVELLGDQRVLVEGHQGVTEYSTDQIGVKLTWGCLCIRGCGLHLRIMTRERLVVSGRIDALTLTRR